MWNYRILSTYPSASIGTLPESCNALLHQQQSSWPQLIEGYSALKDVRVREIRCDGYSVYAQFNPRRIVSSGANVDPKSISQRKCFLCVENLPPEQRGVLYLDEFLVLCNPAPIFDRHLTIAHIKHTPQAIEGFIQPFLELARAMSPAFTVFYNGPKCGASAPDHMHLQACPSGTIPIEREAALAVRRELKISRGAISLYSLKNVGRQIIVMEGNSMSQLGTFLSRLLSAMKQVLGTDEEPMVNLLCSHEAGVWQVIVFPRRKHRPDLFFKEGDERMLISPAAVDIGGLIITPIERDFIRVDARTIQSIFDEVLLNKETVEQVLAAV